MAKTFSQEAVSVVAAAVLFWPVAIHAQAAGSATTLTGVVSDTMCGATHMVKDKSPAECIRMCVKGNTKYALVVDKKVYTLLGHEADLDKLAAQKVTVKGTVKGSTVTVESVAPAT
jgi:hypothetical protein